MKFRSLLKTLAKAGSTFCITIFLSLYSSQIYKFLHFNVGVFAYCLFEHVWGIRMAFQM